MGPGQPVPGSDIPGNAPTMLGEHLVIRRNPQFGAVTELDPDDILLALVEPGADLARLQHAVFIGGHRMDREPTVNDLFDAMSNASHRIEDTGAFRQALVLYDLDSGTTSDWIGAIFKCFYSAHIESYRCIELKRPSARSRFGAIVNDNPVREVVMGALHLNIVSTHDIKICLTLDIEDTCRNRPYSRIHEFSDCSELPTEPREELIFHRWMNIRGKQPLKFLSGCRGELQDTDP